MITPQQRNAWRGAYLRQLRKIASTDILLDGWEDDFDFNNALEAHFAHFTLNDYIVFTRCFSYVLCNHPMAIGYLEKYLKEDDFLSLEELSDFLIPLSNYAKYNVLNEAICDEETREGLMFSIINEDKQHFVELAKTCTNISEICLQCGYASYVSKSYSGVLQPLEEYDELKKLEDDYLDTLEKTRMDSANRYGTDFIDWGSDIKDIIDLVREYSMFNLENLDEELQATYCLLIKSWAYLSSVVDMAFMDKELSIMSDIIIRSQSSELFSDFERLAYLLYGVAPKRLFTPKSFDLQELGLLKSEMPIKDSLSIPWLNDVEE